MSRVWRELATDRPQEEQLIVTFRKPHYFPRLLRFRDKEWPINDSYSYLWYPIPGVNDESPSSDPAELLALRQWKKEATILLNPIMEYGQTHPDIKLGSSTTEFVLNRAKGADVLVKALEKVLNPDYTQQQKQWAAEDALKQYEQLKQQ